MNTFEMAGIAGLYLKYSGDFLDVARGIDAVVLNPPCRTYIRYTAGLTGLAVGAVLTGGTSTAVLNVEGVVITAGTLAGNDAEGIIFVTVVSGIPVTDEDLSDATPTVLAVSRSAVLTIPSSGSALEAKSILITCETGQIRCLWDGSDPTTSTETGDANFGLLLNPTDSNLIKGWTNCRNLKIINAVAATNGVANVFISYGGFE